MGGDGGVRWHRHDIWNIIGRPPFAILVQKCEAHHAYIIITLKIFWVKMNVHLGWYVSYLLHTTTTSVCKMFE